MLSKLIGQKIDSPNKLMLSGDCIATVAVGFPELDMSSSDVFSWFRPAQNGLKGDSVVLNDAAQVRAYHLAKSEYEV